jgi:tRNA-2-methylthio-N6-dimethylallyladenosine synthase
MNEYDSARMAGLLAGWGWSAADSPEEADLILVNTCSVRERAEQKLYSYLGRLRPLKERRPDLLIGVGGCVAQQEGERLLKHLHFLDLVFGPEAYHRLPELIDDARRGRRRALTERAEPGQWARPILPAEPGLKAMLTVMIGCDNFCSYCVVPHTRGRERSRPAGQVVDEAAALVAAGVREITLLGQNVNSYRDPDSGLGFPGLLSRVAGIGDLWRIRFTTSHPKDLSPRLVEVMASEPKVMKQLHLPAQSGSNRILKAMHRGYTREDYLAKIEALRQAVPGVAVGGDFIVGFPGETEEDFALSLGLLDEAGYDFLFSFKYSDRPFTAASRLDGKVKEEEKARRLNRLQARQRQIMLDKHRAREGSLVEVLVEGPARKGAGLMSGRAGDGLTVNFAGGPELAGRLVWVRLDEGRINSAIGRLGEPRGDEL